MRIAWKGPSPAVGKQLVGQGMGGCQLVSTSLQAILFSRTEMVGRAVVIFGGCVSRAEKEDFKEGAEAYLPNPLCPTTSSRIPKPCEGSFQQETLYHCCHSMMGKYISLFLTI